MGWLVHMDLCTTSIVWQVKPSKLKPGVLLYTAVVSLL
jgi:hypothetical protein